MKLRMILIAKVKGKEGGRKPASKRKPQRMETK